ncbi:putative AC transposase [Tanacetum coccineum]
MASESASASATTGVGSTSAPTIREIISTNRNPQIWKDFNLCIMTDNSQKAQCKHCFHFLSVGSNTTLRNHIEHPHCEAKKAQKNQNSEAGQTSMARDGSVFMYDPDYLREQFAGLVIQRALPFNHFDHEQTTRVFQNTMQPRYTHVSRSTLKRDAIKLWLAAKQEIIDSFGFWKENETMFPVLSHMAMDIISAQASSVASESAFSTSGRVLSIRRSRLTPASLEMCMCLKDHLDAKERKQDKCPLETPLDFEEGVFDDEVQQNEVIPLSDEEITLDASSEGTMSPGGPQYDYMLSSEAEDDY